MSKELVQRQFGANAQNYVTSPVHAKGASLARMVELAAPGADWVMLDVATAAGHTAFAFAPHVAQVVATDLTREMLDRAKALAAERGIINVTFAQADAEALPFSDATFDGVTCRIAPHHFSDVASFVAEVARVLKPGGVFALVDNLAPDTNTHPDLDAAALAGAAAGYNAFEKLRDPSHARALTEAEWHGHINAAGLTIATREHLAKAMSFHRWCETMSVPQATRERLRRMLDDAPDALNAYLKPTPSADDIGFEIIELLLVAHKPSPSAT